MKKEIADKLVSALRSGEYEQGNACLRDSKNRFCCLGVLTDLYHKETGKGLWAQSRIGDIFSFLRYEDDHLSADGFLSNEVIDWSGMHSKTGDSRKGEYEALYVMNDSRKPFTEIADHIEKNWEDL